MVDKIMQPHGLEVRVTSDSHFAWIRTRMALERTMMSWVRTSVALIGFGFTIVQFFVRLHTGNDGVPVARPEAPRYLGLALIATGVLVLLVSIVQYRAVARYLLSKEFEPIAGVGEIVRHTPLYVISIIMIFIGCFAFGAVYLHVV
jgi:putative membrane protein